MSRDRDGLTRALEQIPALKERFWRDLKLVGSGADLNQALERAGRVADFLELAELMCRDALARAGLRGRSRLVPALPGTIRGASQNAFHFSRSINSGVRANPRSFKGAVCWLERRRMPLVSWNSGVRFWPSTIHLPLLLCTASSRTTGWPPRTANAARKSLLRSPRQLNSSTPERISAFSPSCAL
jgi:hypothetical protein